MTLRITTDIDDYFRAPAGACLRRSRFFCSSPDAKLFSLFAWGPLGISDTHELFAVFEGAERHEVPRHQLVVLRNVTGVTMESMGVYMRYFSKESRYLRSVAREAVVRPGGVVGILSEGFYPAVRRPYPGKVFLSLGEAVSWLGYSEAELCEWLDDVLELERAAIDPDGDWLTELRHALLLEGASASVANIASRLGLSPRTLQRRIRSHGTSFEKVRVRIFLAEAKRQLQSSDHDLKRIALELGYSSPARLTDAFRREYGVPPTVWREQSRRRSA